MGDPRRLRNKSERPKKLWEVDRIEEERGLVETYGLKNMRELWMATAELKKYRREARRLLSISEEERREDSKKILTKLVKLGILKDTSVIDDVLSLEVKDILERRLQTIVMRKGLARTMAQSRQLITHGYISVNSRTVNRPNHTITLEDNVGYAKQIDISVKTAAPATPSAAPASTEKVATS